MNIVRKLAGRSLTERVCRSYDAYLDGLAELLGRMDITARSYTPDGEKVLKLYLAGTKFTAPVMVESDGEVHPVTPMECHLRNLTYSIPVYTDIHVHRSDGSSSIIPDTFLGKVPLMVGSSRCKEKVGGWFVVHGTKKTIVEQRAHVHNVPLVYHKLVSGVEHWTVSCKSQQNTNVYVTSVKLKSGRLMVTFPKLESEIDIASLLELLGHNVDEIEDQDLFYDLHLEKMDIKLKSTYNLGDTMDERVTDVLKSQLLPHTGHKGFYLLFMCKTLANHIRRGEWTDKDSLFSQRVETVDNLLASLTTNLLRKMKNDVKTYLQRQMNKKNACLEDKEIKMIFKRQTKFSDGLSYAMAVGQWNTQLVDKRIRPGVCQVLQTGSPISPWSQMRRLKSPIRPDQKLTAPRKLHGTTHGFLCPFGTPEGKSVGLETTLSLGATISMESSAESVLDVMGNMLGDPGDGMFVFLNGSLVGGTPDPEKLCQMLREKRRGGHLARDVSVAMHNYLHVRTSGGRLLRALLRNVDIPDIPLVELEKGYLEWLDIYELDTCLVAMTPEEITPKHTHKEIHPGLILGLCAGMVPFPGRKPGARVVYQCAMSKQAIGPNTNMNLMETTSNWAIYSQRPIVRTELSCAFLGPEMDAAGINAIVAVIPGGQMGRSGANQEDSLIFSQGFIDRGGGRTVQYKTVKVSLSANPGEKCFLGLPEKSRMVPCKLQTNGLPKVGQKVAKGEYLVGRIKVVGSSQIDNSVYSPVDGVIDKILKIKERGGSNAYHVRIRKIMIPIVGDKFANRDSQKGVIGCIAKQEDMPFTESGMPVDILINPHAFPSRMTVSYLLEGALAKLGCMEGKFKDGSAFTKVENLNALSTKEVMFNGKTGRKYKEKISIFPIFYQKLKHMASAKLHCRAMGKINELTKAPCAGKQKDGGLRFGEMERDCLTAHGAANMLNERLMKSSDQYKLWVCPRCKGYDCKHKKKPVTIPYSFKLLVTELQAMGIRPKLHT